MKPELLTLLERIAELEDALEPFADRAANVLPTVPDMCITSQAMRAGDFRNAAAVIAKGKIVESADAARREYEEKGGIGHEEMRRKVERKGKK